MEKNKGKPIYKKWWFWVIIALVVITVANSGGDRGDKGEVSDGNASGKTTVSDSEKAESNAEAYEIGEGKVQTWTDSINSQWISAYVPVKNTGTENLYLSAGTLDIEDESGALVQTLNLVSVYPQVLLPGETAYYYEETTADSAIPAGELKVIPHLSIKKSNVQCIRYEVSELTVLDDEFFGANITGRVENNTDTLGKLVYVTANIFDKDGNLLTQQMTILNNDLQPGEKIGFKTTNLSNNIQSKDIDSYEVYAFPFQYQL